MCSSDLRKRQKLYKVSIHRTMDIKKYPKKGGRRRKEKHLCETKERNERGMIRYIAKRVLMMIPVLLGVTLLIFTLLYFADGDPARNLMGADATEEEIQELRAEWGLDDPYLVRYGRYLKQLLIDHDLGTSYVTKQNISTEIISRFKVTFWVAIESTVLALVFGTVLGIIAATHQNTWMDNSSMVAALVGASKIGRAHV